MQDDIIRMLRYNTGNDKKAFIAFKNDFDAVIFNATIVAYSGSAIADLVSVYKNQYIIDPQTHILQQDIAAIMSKEKKTGNYIIKKSVRKFLEQLPTKVVEIIDKQNRPLTITELNSILDELVAKIYIFETEYVDSFIKEKEYDKYLKYVNIGPEPRVVIAPYFMLKKDMEYSQENEVLDINRQSIVKFISYGQIKDATYPVAAQLVMDREILSRKGFVEAIKEAYNCEGYEYIFLWINDFSTFECTRGEKEAFYNLIKMLNDIGKKPVMAYGGYDSILLSHKEIAPRLYGTAQSVGYGEARPITPVGGGLPVNKYYFRPLHKRMRFDEAAQILLNSGYFDASKSKFEHAQDYYSYICNCEKCQEIIKDDIDNFNVYNESIPYIVKARYGEIKRNRPTTEATLVAAFHFLYCKIYEWNQNKTQDFNKLTEQLMNNYEMYASVKEQKNIKEWCDIFGR